jgi:hypothetical protein
MGLCCEVVISVVRLTEIGKEQVGRESGSQQAEGPWRVLIEEGAGLAAAGQD